MTLGYWNNSGGMTTTNGSVLRATPFKDTLSVTPMIGSIIAWAKSFTGVPASLPGGYVECNGQVLSDSESPLDGVTIPDLNSTNSFLRGGDSSGATGGVATHIHTLGIGGSGSTIVGSTPNVSVATSSHSHTVNPSSNIPPYYDVVWIMRVK